MLTVLAVLFLVVILVFTARDGRQMEADRNLRRRNNPHLVHKDEHTHNQETSK